MALLLVLNKYFVLITGCPTPGIEVGKTGYFNKIWPQLQLL